MDEREMFEASRKPKTDLSKEARGGRYKNSVVQACWETWQAASRTTPDRDATVPSDAAIAACALMIKGICMTRPQESWVADIESRIRFMLRVDDPRLDALDRLAENAQPLGLDYMTAPTAESKEEGNG